MSKERIEVLDNGTNGKLLRVWRGGQHVGNVSISASTNKEAVGLLDYIVGKVRG